MKVLILFLSAFITASFIAGQVSAVPPGRTLEWAGAKDSPGKVVFDGKVHADKGLKCNDCHTEIFPMKKGATKMTMADINAGKFCGKCHNGIKMIDRVTERSLLVVFKSSDEANCARCHKK